MEASYGTFSRSEHIADSVFVGSLTKSSYLIDIRRRGDIALKKSMMFWFKIRYSSSRELHVTCEWSLFYSLRLLRDNSTQLSIHAAGCRIIDR